ncbi:tetratricopeptide repeat domain protein [Desulfosarcina variabilis str. Montpellier]
MIGTLIYCLVVFPIVNTGVFNTKAMAQVIDTDALDAEAPSKEIATLSKDEKKALVESGVAQYEQGNWIEARQTLEQAREVFPENFAVPYYLGLIYLKEGQRSAAIAEWQHYVAMDPESENSMKIRKSLTLLLREQAEEYARRAIANEATLTGVPLAENTIAVTPFKNLGSADLGPLGKGMAAMVIHDLSQVGDLQVVERIKLQVLLDEIKLGESNLVETQTAPQVGRLLRARNVTAGTLADLEKENLQIASAVVDAEDDKTIGTQEVQGELKKFYDLEKDIACSIVEDLGKKCSDMPKAFGKVHTESLPAFVAFSQGLEHFDAEEYDAARDKFQEALDEDPDFDLARAALIATPYSAMMLMSTSQLVSSASATGVSSGAAGGAVAASAAGGISLGTTAAIVGGAALIGGGAAALGGGGGGDDGGGSSDAPDVAGNWRGTWTDSDGNSGDIVLSIEQSGTSLTGNAAVNGSECISTGTISGTISDTTLNVTITSGTDRASFRAPFSENTSDINGTFDFEAGACAGDTGSFSMTQTETGGADVSW